MKGPQTVFIVNPHSANGGTGREWPRMEVLARDRLGSFPVFLTTGPGDATRIARQQLRRGAELIVCVGGDGTLNEVVNGFMQREGPVREDAILAFLPNGTGCDFCRTVPIPPRIEASLDTIRKGCISPIDLGRLQFRSHDGRTAIRYFHNITSFGLGGEVVDRVNRTSKAMGPFVSFIWATLLSLFLYGKKRIRLRVDDAFDEQVTIWNIAVANGQYHGGGMQVAPEASVVDGLFHVTIIGDLLLPQVFRHLPKLYNGKIRSIRQVTTLTGKRVEATSRQEVLLDVDGEQPGELPVVLDIVPRAIRILTDTLPV